ncbi:unnamed protein product, partial [Symbiodinium necroappetens]
VGAYHIHRREGFGLDASKVARASWQEGGKRYLEIDAEQDDMLQQLFQEPILAENGFSMSMDPALNFQRVVECLDAVTRRQGPIHDKKRWCAWSFNADGFQKKYSSTLLLVMWSSIEEGKNPFFVEKKDEEGKKGDFDRILELCVKEPGSARQRSTSSHDMSGIRPGSGG